MSAATAAAGAVLSEKDQTVRTSGATAEPSWRVEVIGEEAASESAMIRVLISIPHLETASEVEAELNRNRGQIRVTGPGRFPERPQELFTLLVPIPEEADGQSSTPPRWSKRRRELFIDFSRKGRHQQDDSHLLHGAAAASRASAASHAAPPAPPFLEQQEELPTVATGIDAAKESEDLPPEDSDAKAPVLGFEEGPQGARFRRNNWRSASGGETQPTSGAGSLSSGQMSGGGTNPAGAGYPGSSCSSSSSHSSTSVPLGDPLRPGSAGGLPDVVSSKSKNETGEHVKDVDGDDVLELGFDISIARPPTAVAPDGEKTNVACSKKQTTNASSSAPPRRGPGGGISLPAEQEVEEEAPKEVEAVEIGMGKVLDVDELMTKLREKGLGPPGQGNGAVSVDPVTGRAEACEIDPVAVDMASALMLGAAASVGDAKKVRALLEAKVNPDLADETDTSALEKACAGGQFEVARVLLEGGAKAKGLKSSSSTPLHRAAAGGHERILEMLLRHGADPKRKDKTGRRAEALAMNGGVRQRLQEAAEAGA